MGNNNSSLTIAQGLRRVKLLKGRLAEAEQRATASSSWEAGRKPAFSFVEQRARRAELQDEVARIQTAIAVANATATVTVRDERLTLCHAIRRLQELKADLAWLAGIDLAQGPVARAADEYDEERGRYVRRTTSVTFEAAMSLQERVDEIDRLRDVFDALNDAVETANHRTPIAVPPPAAEIGNESAD